MELVINNNSKKETFISIFHTLKNSSNNINVIFETSRLFIQGMNLSQICMFEVIIPSDWFDKYIVSKATNICFDSHIFYLIISSTDANSNIHIFFNEDDNPDNLHIHLIHNSVNSDNSKGLFNKYFKLPLADNEQQLLHIPDIDYDVEFSISSKKICETFSQMIVFGSDITIQCNEEKIDLITNGIAGEMCVNIPIDDLTSYSIVEGEEFNLKYSLTYINKMCITNKLSSEIDFFISSNYPMKLHYNLGNSASLVFYMAPKTDD
jgi:proliferating cell nuclear antigen PCNA